MLANSSTRESALPRGAVEAALALGSLSVFGVIWVLGLDWLRSADSLSGLHVVAGMAVVGCYLLAFPVWSVYWGAQQSFSVIFREAGDTSARHALVARILCLLAWNAWVAVGLSAASSR